MESFTLGEIVWAKIRGYPWWPAKIIGTENSKEMKYRVNFIGDNTYSFLPKKYLAKFAKEYHTHAKLAKKELRNSIRQARALYKNHTNMNNKSLTMKKNERTYHSSLNVPQENKDEKFSEDFQVSFSMPINSSPNDTNSIPIHLFLSKETDSHSFLMKKTNRLKEEDDEEEEEEEPKSNLIYKIVLYLIYIAKELDDKNIAIIEEDKECLLKVLAILKNFHMNYPIDFLKKTNIGKLVKYIYNIVTIEGEIKDILKAVYTNFESQVLTQLSYKGN